MATTRREFIVRTGLLAGALGLPRIAGAAPIATPPGLQLWAVQDVIKQDLEGTLRALGQMGYRRIEAAGWYDRTPRQFRDAVRAAGLDPYSAHHSLRDLIDDTENKLAFARDVGVKYIVASSPAPRKALDPNKPWVHASAEAMTLDDWRSNAEEMNRIGARAAAMGMRFAYHNHPAEFLAYDRKLAYRELMRLTDPDKVAFELDIGWAAAAGYDPVEVLRQYGDRIHLLHIKDIRTAERVPGKIVDDLTTVPIGQGTVDWPAVFRAARGTRVNGWFVELEPPFAQASLKSMEQSIDYLKTVSI